MRQGLLLAFWLLAVAFSPVQAQEGDALDLPAALFVLTNEGRVDRYGLGSEGIRAVTPQSAFVLDFGVAPDGDWLAYRTETMLALRRVSNGEGVTLDEGGASVPSVRGQGDTIAWSPGGDAIAVTTLEGGRVYLGSAPNPFTNAANVVALDLAEGAFYQFIWSPDGRYLAGEVADNVWWIYRRDGNTLSLTSAITSSVGVAWTSGFEIAFAPLEGGLYLMNLDNANAQTTLLDDTWNYALPTLADDDLLKFFGRQKADPVITEGFGRLLGLAAGTPAVQNLSEVAVELAGLQWAPRGHLMIALRNSTLILLDPVTGNAFTLPIENAVAYDWGVPPVEAGNS